MVEENKTEIQRVVGLGYEPGKGLPRVVLKGSGILAERIVEEGWKNDAKTPIVQDEKLVDALFRLPTDAEIGPELFEMVAVLLAHVFAVNMKMKEDLK